MRVDIWDKTKTVGISLFFEMGAPVYKGYSINNCLVADWIFHDYGEGEHFFGYNRLGITFIAKTSKKKK